MKYRVRIYCFPRHHPSPLQLCYCVATYKLQFQKFTRHHLPTLSLPNTHKHKSNPTGSAMFLSSCLRRRSHLRSAVELIRRGLATASPVEAVPPPSLPPFDHQPRPYTGISGEEILHKRRTYLGPSLFHYYQNPVIY